MPSLRWLRRVLSTVALVVALAGCSRSDGPAVRLDGSPRVPDAEGVVVAASRRALTLEGGRTYKVSDKLIAFSTYTRRAVSLLGTKGDYVQVGLNGDTVTWLGRVGVVMNEDPAKPVVVYQGDLRRTGGDRLEFVDGTVLRLAKGLKVTDMGGPGLSYVVIDTRINRVQGITLPPERIARTTTTRS